MSERKRKAQAVTELTVFGAILIFVIGSILRNSVDSGMNQNQSLKAMRWALLQSLNGVRNVNKSRDSASVIFIEDRLSPDVSKFGSLERVPLMQSGSGTFSNTLFMPLDWLEYHNVPVMDLFVNGTHFVFTTARFIVYDVRIDPNNANLMRIWDLTNNIVSNRVNPNLPISATNPGISRRGNWKDDCVATGIGCPILYRQVPSNSIDFCYGICDDTITLEQRFDLNRNDNYGDDVSSTTMRSRMAWQWGAVMGLTRTTNPAIKIPVIDPENGNYPLYDVDGDRKEETIFAINPTSLWEKTGSTYNVQQGDNPIVHPDVNMAELEATSGVVRTPIFDTDGTTVIGEEIRTSDVAQQFYVMDAQKGDVDGSFDDTDMLAFAQALTDRGLLRDLSGYTQTNDGTYLEINEGRAYVPSFNGAGEFVRSVNKKDSLDIITRVFQLDNNTGRYCSTRTGARWPTIGNISGGMPNPVQYCVDTVTFPTVNCFSPVTTGSVCLDTGTKKLFIRSRIQDTGGRKWVTQTK